jgi:hypothetical protein
MASDGHGSRRECCGRRKGDDMVTGDWIMLAICITLVLLPMRWDPAIRLKGWTEREQKNGRDNKDAV